MMRSAVKPADLKEMSRREIYRLAIGLYPFVQFVHSSSRSFVRLQIDSNLLVADATSAGSANKNS